MGLVHGRLLQGCAGGWPTDPLNYVFKYNLTTEAKYPFKYAPLRLCSQFLLHCSCSSRSRQLMILLWCWAEGCRLQCLPMGA
jgi:hypothetical protein